MGYSGVWRTVRSGRNRRLFSVGTSLRPQWVNLCKRTGGLIRRSFISTHLSMRVPSVAVSTCVELRNTSGIRPHFPRGRILFVWLKWVGGFGRSPVPNVTNGRMGRSWTEKSLATSISAELQWKRTDSWVGDDHGHRDNSLPTSESSIFAEAKCFYDIRRVGWAYNRPCRICWKEFDLRRN